MKLLFKKFGQWSTTSKNMIKKQKNKGILNSDSRNNNFHYFFLFDLDYAALFSPLLLF